MAEGNLVLKMFSDMTTAVNDVSEAFSNLKNAEEKLDTFERNIRISDPTYSQVFDASNDTKRKLILERSYLAPPNEGVWYELKTDIRLAEVELKRRDLGLQVARDALKLIKITPDDFPIE